MNILVFSDYKFSKFIKANIKNEGKDISISVEKINEISSKLNKKTRNFPVYQYKNRKMVIYNYKYKKIVN